MIAITTFALDLGTAETIVILVFLGIGFLVVSEV